MGRRERRLAERLNQAENRKGKKLMSKEDLSKFSDEVSKYNVETLMTCFALVLHREFGFGKVRIFRLLNAVDMLMGKILDDTATINDYKKQLADETGVRIET